MTFDPASFISGLGGVILGCGLFAMVIKAKWAEVGELKRDVQELRDKRVQGLEGEVRDLRAGGCSVGIEVRTKLGTVISQNNEIMLELKKLNRESENQVTRITGAEKSVSSLWNKFDHHRENHPGPSARTGG